MAEEQQANGAAAENQQQQPQFAIQRIYAKDISFETPSSPAIFRKEWKPELKLDLNVKHEKIEDGVYEVVLTLTATNKVEDDVAFLCEVHQAGIFTIGDVTLEVVMETDPCEVMEEKRAGLIDAMTPDWRGGVCCKVLSGGSMKLGDKVQYSE